MIINDNTSSIELDLYKPTSIINFCEFAFINLKKGENYCQAISIKGGILHVFHDQNAQ